MNVRRRAIHVCTIASLLVGIGSIALWHRSYACCDEWAVNHGRTYDVGTRRGRLVFSAQTSVRMVQSGPGGAWVDPPSAGLAPEWRFRHHVWATEDWFEPGVLGFDVSSGDVEFGTSLWQIHHEGTSVVVPLWFVTACALVLPARWGWRRFRRRDERAPGACVRCGYDLTGNVSGVCPECGRAVGAED